MRDVVHSLPHCRDDVPPPPLPACETEGRAVLLEGRLCAGIAAILAASCQQLGNVSFVHDLVGSVGMVPDTRRDRLWGDAWKYMVQSPIPNAGLWQDPKQLAGALIHLAVHARIHEYVEVGIYTAWSTCTIAAYLTRTMSGAPGRFHGYAVDVTDVHVRPTTQALLKALNVEFRPRKSFDAEPAPPIARGAGTRRHDLCFIDGDHTYEGVRRDYTQLAGACGWIMLHDVQDTSTLKLHGYGGGVPLFWADLSSNVGPERVATFTAQSSDFLPMFGIGLIAPGAGAGTAEPDRLPVAEWPARRAGGGAEALWHELCVGRGAAGGAGGGGAAAATEAAADAHHAAAVRRPHRHRLASTARLCSVCTPKDFYIFLAASERRIKRGYLQYAAARWYCNQTASECDDSGGGGGRAAWRPGPMPKWVPSGPIPEGEPALGAGALLAWPGR